MFNPYTAFVGIRYTGARRRSQLVSFISLVSMTGMAIAVALLILVLSVMNGFDREMRTRILGLVPHVTLLSYGNSSGNSSGQNKAEEWLSIEKKLLQHPEVLSAAPFAQLSAMLLKGSDVEGVLLYGIDPEKEAAVSVIGDYVAADKLQTLADQDGKVSNSILLGKALADRLGLEVGDRVNVMIPQQNAAGRVSPKFVGLQLVALLNTGTELDQSLALTSLQRVLLLMPEQERQQGLRISVTDTFNAPRIAWELSQNIPYGYIARDWTRSHGNLYSAIQLSKQLVGLMLLTIIAVASFNVVSALVMIVTDKRGDIAILRTLGASPAGVMMVFMVQGTLIALIGTTVGGLVGLALAYGITDVVAVVESLFNIHFLNSDVYPIDYLPSDPRLNDVLLVCGTALLMSLLATVYPAWRAARVQPADALRYQ